MKKMPNIKIAPFEDLVAGDLLIYFFEGSSCLAMKAFDNNPDGDKLLLILGPKFPAGAEFPHISMAAGFTAVSYGKDYKLLLPSAEDGWSQFLPPADTPSILVTNDDIYFRARFSHDRTCFVRASDGLLVWQQPSPPKAFITKWEIFVGETFAFEQRLLKHP